MKKLYLSNKDKKIEGVCGGLAEYFGIDSTIIRIIAVLLAISSFGTALVAYIICCIIIPKKPFSQEW